MTFFDPVRTWRRSSVCEATDCVEVSLCADRIVVRDSKLPEGSSLTIALPGWRSFISAIKRERVGMSEKSIHVATGVTSHSVIGFAHVFSTSQNASK
ncbi:hypothetical protein GCM10010503_35610 [Streptomyces lucensis JCM 4490]|uniref:DUF397 domain-containing protein n=1 Tax=Streptomyces lucensis JCM 4490 TaxID=1306176 RepID=A0A918MT49_9ACTN|nr:DUF397 domain-containing protein [Streptomyces lucensis]GGW55432.1 hypothetical protein GCM10010503_35610 [Streptomyces lucensis JCM 4490]